MEENNKIKNIERAEYDTELLEKILSTNEENNILLKRIRRGQKLNNLFRIFYWVIIISTVFGLYYFLQPTINSVMSNFEGLKDALQNISTKAEQLPDVNKIKGLLDNINLMN